MISKKLIFAITLCALSWMTLTLAESSVRKVALKGTVALTFDDGPTVLSFTYWRRSKVSRRVATEAGRRLQAIGQFLVP